MIWAAAAQIIPRQNNIFSHNLTKTAEKFFARAPKLAVLKDQIILFDYSRHFSLRRFELMSDLTAVTLFHSTF